MVDGRGRPPGLFLRSKINPQYMAKTKELEIVCASSKCQSNYDAKIRVTVDLDASDMSALINSIPQEDIKKYLDDAVFKEWAEENGYVKEVEVK